MAKNRIHADLAIKCPECGIILHPYPTESWERVVGIKKFLHPVGNMDNNYNSCSQEGKIIEKLIYREN